MVGDWTGHPGRQDGQGDDVQGILNTEDRLRQRVRGQDAALEIIAKELRAARAGLKPSSQPMGVFLLVGPSGVGKTETALGLADLLFGGERFVVTINMSEFQERHTVSRLVGSPPGYVGFGEGGRPHRGGPPRAPTRSSSSTRWRRPTRRCSTIFYQVFDKGMLADGEGRIIDFKNTVVILTSNLATDLITSAAPPGGELPSMEDLTSLIKPTLSAHFKPALLARMTVVPYVPIGPEALLGVVKIKVGAVIKRAKEAHGVVLSIDEAVYGRHRRSLAARWRAARATSITSSAVSSSPLVSGEILRRMAEEQPLTALQLSLDASGDIVITGRRFVMPSASHIAQVAFAALVSTSNRRRRDRRGRDGEPRLQHRHRRAQGARALQAAGGQHGHPRLAAHQQPPTWATRARCSCASTSSPPMYV